MKRPQKKSKTLCRSRGLTQDLIVTRKGESITLWSAAGIRHTVFDIAAPHMPGLEYARNTLAALAFCPKAESCLVLGLGGGSIPRMMLKARPQIIVDAVEIDPTVVDLATTYFGINTLPRFTVHTEDAARFLKRCTRQYGVIIIDTYLGEQFPDQCSTEEFIRNIRNCLIADGVIVINWLSANNEKRDVLLRSIQSIIGPVWKLPGRKSRNILYFTSTKKITRSEIISAATAVQEAIPFKNSLRQQAQRIKNAG